MKIILIQRPLILKIKAILIKKIQIINLMNNKFKMIKMINYIKKNSLIYYIIKFNLNLKKLNLQKQKHK